MKINGNNGQIVLINYHIRVERNVTSRITHMLTLPIHLCLAHSLTKLTSCGFIYLHYLSYLFIYFFVPRPIPPKRNVTFTLKVDHCKGVNFLEHVQARITLTTQRRGDIVIYLTSPSGTRTCLLTER